MKTFTLFAAAIIAAGSATAQKVDFPPPTYNRVIIPVPAAPSAPAYLIPNPIGVNDRGEVLFWARQTSGKPMPANREWYSVYKWLPGADTSSLVTTLGDENGRYATWMPRHGFNNAGQFAVMRTYYAPQIGLINALGTWSGGGWNDFWATTIGPTYPGYPHTPYDMNSAGDVVFASYYTAAPDMLWIVAGGVLEKYAGRGGGAIYQASSGMVRFFFPGTTNTCLPFRINNAGLAVGIVTGNSSDFQYKWRGFTGTFAGGATEFAFPGPRGGVTQPTGINGAGEIVGLSGTFPLGWAPFIYLPSPKYGLTAGLHEIAPATPSTAEPSHLDENNRFLSHEALINDSGQVIFNYHNHAPGLPGFWQLGHQWTLTSMMGDSTTNEFVIFAQDINNRGEILAAMDSTRRTVLLRPLLAARLTLQTETCPGGPFTLHLTVTNQSGRLLTQLAAPLLEWNGTGSFTILDPATVSGPSPLPDGQTAEITWRLQLSGASPDGFFVSQATALDPTKAVINSLLAQSPGIDQFFHTEVAALPKRLGIWNDVEVHVTAFNGTTKTLLNVHPDGPPSPSATGRVRFKSGPVPAGSVTLKPGDSFTFTNVFTATNTGTVEFSANVVGTCDGSPIIAGSGTSGTVRIADRGDLLIKRADESASLYGINDEYQLNPTGAQVRTNTVALAQVSEFNVQVQNDETNAHIYSLKADESGNLGWDVKYLLNGVDISAAVRAASGTSLPELAGGASYTLSVRMTATNAVAGDRKSSLLVLGNPLAPGEILDAVQAVTDLAFEIIVNTTGDEPDASLTDGVPDVDLTKPGLQTTLRCAMDFANRRPGKNIIKFQIPANDPGIVNGIPRIAPQSALPDITAPVIIDGWSQRPEAAYPPIELTGGRLQRPPPPHAGNVETFGSELLNWDGAISGLLLDASGCEVRGLVINWFSMCGIEIYGTGCLVQGCFVGTDVSGTAALANGFSADEVEHVRGAGIFISSSGNIIGGDSIRMQNIISGSTGTMWDGYATQGLNAPPGILIGGAAASENLIQGNFIGVDVTGRNLMFGAKRADGQIAAALAGVWIASASYNVIGGERPHTANLISGNRSGVRITRPESSVNLVLGNFIGSDVDGVNPLGNGAGVSIHSATLSIIGGNSLESGNLISGNFEGVIVEGAEAVDNFITWNLIGPNKFGRDDSAAALSNARGILLMGDSGRTTITHNRIAYNLGVGIRIDGSYENEISTNGIYLNGLLDDYRVAGIRVSEGSRNRISSNVIYDNGGPGITFNFSATPTPNDDQDADEGPNGLQNYPDVASVIATPTQATFVGFLSSRPSNTYRIEVFVSVRICDFSK